MRTFSWSVVVGMVTLSVLVSGCQSAAQPTPTPSVAAAAATRLSDVDGDGRVDIVVLGGGPGADLDTQVAVVLGTGVIQTVTSDEIQKANAAAVKFDPTSIAVGDVNRDGYADLVLIGSTDTASAALALWGSAQGVSAQHSSILAELPGDARSVAFLPLPTPTLAVSFGQEYGASVNLYPVNSSGTLGDPRTLTPDSVKGREAGPRTEDHNFGERLVATGDRLLVSTGERAVYAVRLLAHEQQSVTVVTRQSLGLAKQHHDDFGEVFSTSGDQVVVGSPDATVAGQSEAGSVVSFRLRNSGDGLATDSVVEVNQNSPEVPGALKAGNGYGWVVQAITPCEGKAGALVAAAADDGRKGEATYGSGSSVIFPEATGCARKLGVRHVLTGYLLFTVVRTDPSGRKADTPVVGLADANTLLIGWLGDQRTIDLGSKTGMTAILELAQPAA